MRPRADSRRWATPWLVGILRAIEEGRMPPAAQASAVARARTCGLSSEEINVIVTTHLPRVDRGPSAAWRADD